MYVVTEELMMVRPFRIEVTFAENIHSELEIWLISVGF